MERKILLVGVNSKYIHSNLAVRYMSAYADVPYFECTVNDDIFSVYRKIVETAPEYICFSVYIWNVEFITRLCGMLSVARSDLKIIFGGPEAGYDKENFFNKYEWLFGICTGEGEDFILNLKTEESLDDVVNLSYRKDGKIVVNPYVKTVLSKIKFPYTKSDFEGELKNRIVYFETSRGCLFNCSYCLSSNEGKTRTFPMEYVKSSLKFFMENKVPLVKLVDRTFNEDNERACRIVSYILENNICTRFHFEISPLLLTEEFINLCAKKPDYFQFEMGIQTTNSETMKAIRRSFNPEKVSEVISKIPRSIHQHLDLIAGLPHETFESFRNGFNFVYSLKPHMLQVGFLKLLNHTKMKADAQSYGIKTTEFPPYEVIQTESMSYSDIIKIKKLENAVDRIYNSNAFSETLNDLKINDAFEFYLEMGEELYKKEYGEPLSRASLYEFMYEKFPEMKKSLTVDFLKNNRKAVLPECFSDYEPNAKHIHKFLSKHPDFSGKKFRIVFASGCVFSVTEHGVTEITDIIREISLQAPNPEQSDV